MAVTPLSGKKLWVSFRNGQARHYDCEPLLLEPAFYSLQNEAFFRGVQAAPHGYAVIWSDEVDLSEAELWLNGEPQPQVTIGELLDTSLILSPSCLSVVATQAAR